MNNKQSMKLYTEEQLKKAIELAQECEHECGGVYFDYTEKEIIDELTPIELPSDEDIREWAKMQSLGEPTGAEEFGRIYGAKWMRDLIQGGSK